METYLTELSNFLNACSQRVEKFLDHHLPAANQSPQDLHNAMRYSSLGNGKRVRPALVYATGEALQIDAAQLDLLLAVLSNLDPVASRS